MSIDTKTRADGGEQPAGYHEWVTVCRCCGIERRQRYLPNGFLLTEYLVDEKWLPKRPDCRVVAADKEALRG